MNISFATMYYFFKPWWNLILGNPMRASFVTCFNHSGVTFSAVASYHLVPYDMGILVGGTTGASWVVMGTDSPTDENFNVGAGSKASYKSRVISSVFTKNSWYWYYLWMLIPTHMAILNRFYSFTWPRYHVLSPIFRFCSNPDPSNLVIEHHHMIQSPIYHG